ncbi:MAG: zinc ribbon domain-containing protein [Candidatus Aenigmarchaeota archaeon]|nr:zinc ribbon domain-containing protein [Candidatus Aenigmarchaeota archaeon]
MVQGEAEVIPGFEFFFQQLGIVIKILIILIVLTILYWLVKIVSRFRKKFCTCGNELKPGEKFCPKCGKKVE